MEIAKQETLMIDILEVKYLFHTKFFAKARQRLFAHLCTIINIDRYLSPPVKYLCVLENPPEMESGGFFYGEIHFA